MSAKIFSTISWSPEVSICCFVPPFCYQKLNSSFINLYPLEKLSYTLAQLLLLFYSHLNETKLTLVCFDLLHAVLQIVASHQSLPTIWVSWSVKIDADFLK